MSAPETAPVRTTAKELAERVNAMSPGDRLRLAAGLLNRGDWQSAAVIVSVIKDELTLVALLKGSGR